MFLDTSMYLCCQIYLYEFRYNHSTFVDLPDCCRDKEKGLITQSSVAQYKIKREDCNPLFSFSVATKFTYLNYIMNFSKVNIRDLAEAKYEDTYLLITTRFPCFTLALYGETFTFCQSKNLFEYEFDSCYILVNYRVKNSLTI